MFNNLFENRNKTVSELIKLGDYLGRSLRENVSIFKIDMEDKSVCYVTESNKVIAGTFETDGELSLQDIVVEDIEAFLNQDKFDSMVDSKISGFVKNIYEDSHKKAKSSFDDLLYLWESRLKFKSIKNKLDEKVLRFNESGKIIESEEFQKFLEVAPQLVAYLKANKEKISKISEIRNAIRLSQTISEAFDIPKYDYDALQEDGSFTVNDQSTKSVYDMICRHELVKKELLEHKANFDSIWASNQKVQNLAGLIYSDERVVAEALANAISDVPYLALASKKQLTETFKNALSLNNVKDIQISDIQKYSSEIFEMKKPIKAELINHLNERYGINVQNLKDPASFKSLLNTQVVIFETLAKISPKKSVQRAVLMDLVESLKTKNGVQAIDCNEIIQEVFIAAGYDDIVINESLGNYLDFNKIATDLTKVSDILKMISGAAGGGDAAAAAQAMQPTSQMGMQPKMDPTAGQPPSPQGMDDDDVAAPPAGPEQGMGQEGEDSGDAEMQAAIEAPQEPTEVDMSDDQYGKVMSDLEEILASLKSELDIDSGEGEMGDEEMPEEEGEEQEEDEDGVVGEMEVDDDGMEDEEDDIDDEQAGLDAEEDAIEAKHEKAHEIEDEAEEEEDVVRKKQKKAEKKEDKFKRMK